MITQHNNTKKPWKWSEEVVREVWCKNVGIVECGGPEAFAGMNGKKMLEEVTDVEWMVKRRIPRANAQGAFKDIERLRKLAKEKSALKQLHFHNLNSILKNIFY